MNTPNISVSNNRGLYAFYCLFDIIPVRNPLIKLVSSSSVDLDKINSFFFKQFQNLYKRLIISIPGELRFKSTVIQSFRGVFSRFIATRISVVSSILEYASEHLPSIGWPNACLAVNGVRLIAPDTTFSIPIIPYTDTYLKWQRSEPVNRR